MLSVMRSPAKSGGSEAPGLDGDRADTGLSGGNPGGRLT